MKLNDWVKKYTSSSFKIDYKNQQDLKNGDIVKVYSFSLDNQDVYEEYGYVVGDVNVKETTPWVKIHLQRENKTVKMVLTDSIKKIREN